MKNHMRVALVFPPGLLEAAQPYASLPYLAAAVRQRGHAVTQHDLALEALHHFLAPERLAQTARHCRRRFGELDRKRALSLDEQSEYLRHCGALLRGDAIAHWEEGQRILRDPAQVLQPARLHFALRSLEEAAQLASAGLGPAAEMHISGTRVSFGQRFRLGSGTFPELLKAISDRRENPLIEYFEEHVLPGLLAESPNVVGISLTYPEQLVPGLTLARLLKAQAPEVHVCLGGTVLFYIEETLHRQAALWDIIDSAILYEGETALVSLLDCLAQRGDLSRVPNTMSWRDGAVVVGPRCVEDLDALPCPAYDDVALDRYLCPEPVLGLLPTRGCYWNKCAFCGMSPSTGTRYRERSPELFVGDVQQLHQRLGVRHFTLNGDAVTPKWLVRMSERLVAAGLDVRWESEVRLERAFTAAVCRKLYRGGCRGLRFGLESGNQRVLDAMSKGIRLDDVRQVLRNCHEAGIRVVLGTFVGFPGETKDEARDTLQFILENRATVSSVAMGSFLLVHGSRVQRSPADYGVEALPAPGVLQFASDYQVRSGLSRQAAERMCRVALETVGRVAPSLVQAPYDAPCDSPYALLYADRAGTLSGPPPTGPAHPAATLKTRFDLDAIEDNLRQGTVSPPLAASAPPLRVHLDESGQLLTER